MKQIELVGGKFAIVDDEDYERIAKFKWNLTWNGYAKRVIYENKKTVNIAMHRIILNVSEGFEIDHINRNKLDNRKENLRICTHVENMRNRDLRIDNTSGFKGVIFNKNKRKWEARIQFRGKRLYCGQFNNKIEAALAYNEYAKRLYGDFAFINII